MAFKPLNFLIFSERQQQIINQRMYMHAQAVLGARTPATPKGK